MRGEEALHMSPPYGRGGAVALRSPWDRLRVALPLCSRTTPPRLALRVAVLSHPI